jgi:uncharacterized protein (TIGR04222 family)
MNPFDLRGPEFLVFYIFFSWLVIVGVTLLRRLSEDRDVGKPPIDDPYFVAFLRGGESEALRVAALSLIDRGLLTLKSSGTPALLPGSADSLLVLADPAAIETVKRPLEKRILEAFKTALPIHSTLAGLQGCTACFDYAINLEKFGLLPDEEVRKARLRRVAIAIGILLGVAAVKIFIALSRGHTNIVFLIILSCLAAFIAFKTSNPFRTLRGEKFLQDVKSLFSSLRQRAASLRPGGATSDLVWLASAYGLAEVSPILFPSVMALRPRKPIGGSGSGGWGGWSSGNSSCGTSSSCGSGGSSCSGGGGCGGGGCGGGCGGCGS